MKFTDMLENNRQLGRLNKIHELADELCPGDRHAKINTIISEIRASLIQIERCIHLDEEVPVRHMMEVENGLQYLENMFDDE